MREIPTLNSVKERGSHGAFTLSTHFARRGGNAQRPTSAMAAVQGSGAPAALV